jgi:hypothetical protein
MLVTNRASENIGCRESGPTSVVELGAMLERNRQWWLACIAVRMANLTIDERSHLIAAQDCNVVVNPDLSVTIKFHGKICEPRRNVDFSYLRIIVEDAIRRRAHVVIALKKGSIINCQPIVESPIGQGDYREPVVPSHPKPPDWKTIISQLPSTTLFDCAVQSKTIALSASEFSRVLLAENKLDEFKMNRMGVVTHLSKFLKDNPRLNVNEFEILFFPKSAQMCRSVHRGFRSGIVVRHASIPIPFPGFGSNPLSRTRKPAANLRPHRSSSTLDFNTLFNRASSNTIEQMLYHIRTDMLRFGVASKILMSDSELGLHNRSRVTIASGLALFLKKSSITAHGYTWTRQVFPSKCIVVKRVQ